MIDYYRIARNERCPWCGGELALLQGKNGPCMMLVWEQGQRAPVDQLVDDDVRLASEDLLAQRHPDGTFLIIGDCAAGHPLRLQAVVENGVWTTTDFSEEERFIAEKRERERVDRMRQSWQ